MSDKPTRPAPAMQDQLVTAESSMFGTRLPRPTGVGRHLFVVLIISAAALAIAIAFAERDTAAASAPATAAP